VARQGPNTEQVGQWLAWLLLGLTILFVLLVVALGYLWRAAEERHGTRGYIALVMSEELDDIRWIHHLAWAVFWVVLIVQVLC
jgi:hypothetical protein